MPTGTCTETPHRPELRMTPGTLDLFFINEKFILQALFRDALPYLLETFRSKFPKENRLVLGWVNRKAAL